MLVLVLGVLGVGGGGSEVRGGVGHGMRLLTAKASLRELMRAQKGWSRWQVNELHGSVRELAAGGMMASRVLGPGSCMGRCQSQSGGNAGAAATNNIFFIYLILHLPS